VVKKLEIKKSRILKSGKLIEMTTKHWTPLNGFDSARNIRIRHRFGCVVHPKFSFTGGELYKRTDVTRCADSQIGMYFL
jgi:hypothetical protein